MPWKTIRPMDLKLQFIDNWKSGAYSKADLSRKYHISRKTVHKWLDRYTEGGIEGLKEHSRAPKRCPHRTPEEVVKLLVAEKLKNRNRGPKKIHAQLRRSYPSLHLPSVSTIAYWLNKEGLVDSRKRRPRVPSFTEPFLECDKPNSVWSIDFKGQFRMRDHRLCYPLTLSDNYSRYLLSLKALSGTHYLPVRTALESAFREYGLPDAIRSDNGTPFASAQCLGGLSQLSIWFIQLGIIPERIEKGCPEQNGRHERMHRTLKKDTLNPVGSDLKEQQERFDLFRHDYNYDRPHEALHQKTPNEYYSRSDRPYITHPKAPEYDLADTVRQVHLGGEIKFAGKHFYVSGLLKGQPVALKQIDEDKWQLRYGFYVIGCVDLKHNKLIRNLKKCNP